VGLLGPQAADTVGGRFRRVGGGDVAAATAGIPAVMLPLYQQAAATCPGLPWTVLAASGTVEPKVVRVAEVESDDSIAKAIK
jgi:hypothetical protein